MPTISFDFNRLCERGAPMIDLFRLRDTDAVPKWFFPRSHGVPRVDDRQVLSGIILGNRKSLR